MRQDDSSRAPARAGLLVVLLAAVLLAGCATAPGPAPPGPGAAPAATAPAPGDPLERTNRRLFRLGRALDRAFVRPIVGGYRRIAPRPVRTAVHNVLQNLDEPLVFLNDVLQLHPGPAVRTVARFAANSTVGLAGVFDPATAAGLPHHDNGFGSTLGRYGVRPGPFVFVPLLGPTSLRDMVGEGVDFVTDPLSSVLPRGRTVTITRTALTLLDEREAAEDELRKLEAAADPYATVRSVYQQSREAEIHGEDAPLEALPEIPEAPAPPPAPAPAPEPEPEVAAPPVANPAPPQ